MGGSERPAGASGWPGSGAALLGGSSSQGTIIQADVQRRGGICAKYPTACVVRDLLNRAGLLRPFKRLRVLDLTYGQGIFWLALPQVLVVGFDVVRLEWRRRPRCFIKSYAQRWRDHREEVEECLGGPPDLIAVDPPWQNDRNGAIGKRYHYKRSRAAGGHASIVAAALEAASYYNVPLLYHYNSIIEREHLAGPVEFRHFLCILNKKARNCGSWFGVLRVV